MSNISKISLGGEVYDITLTQEKFNALLKGGSPGLTYEISEDGTYASCTGIGDCADTDIVIASAYQGKPVTSIGEQAFLDCISLTSVTIPDSVMSIGNSSFSSCTSLESVTIPDSVESIGNDAFLGCQSLKSIEIPGSVTDIGNYAFSFCAILKSIVIPEGVESIGSQAFYGCYGLTSVTIPDSVTSIGYGALAECPNLTIYCEAESKPEGWNNEWIYSNTPIVWGAVLDFPAVNDKLIEIQGLAIVGSEGLTYELSEDGTYAICTERGSCEESDVIIASEYEGVPVTSIGDYAFSGYALLTSITIPNSVTSIGKYAFNNSRLTSITIPNSMTSIGDYAFWGCNNLTSITIHNSVTSIGVGAFYGCDKLTSITIPDSVTSIGTNAFEYCESLASIEIPDSVTSIDDFAFSDCYNLTSITIPDSVTSIGFRAFAGCSSLTIYCEAKARPEGWDTSWNLENRPVVWGAALDIPAVNAKLTQLEENTGSVTLTYTNDTPMVKEHGGIAAGATFDNVSIQDMLTMILYPYIEIEVGTPEADQTPKIYYVHDLPTLKSVAIPVKKNSATNLQFSLWDTTKNVKVVEDMILTESNIEDNKLTFSNLNYPIDTTRNFAIKYTYKGKGGADSDEKTVTVGEFTINFQEPTLKTLTSNLGNGNKLDYYTGQGVTIQDITVNVDKEGSASATGGITKVVLYRDGEEAASSTVENLSLPYTFDYSDTIADSQNHTYTVRAYYNARTGDSTDLYSTYVETSPINITFSYRQAEIQMTGNTGGTFSKLDPQEISNIKATFTKYSDAVGSIWLQRERSTATTSYYLVGYRELSGYDSDIYSDESAAVSFDYTESNVCTTTTMWAQVYGAELNNLIEQDSVTWTFYAPYCYGFVDKDVTYDTINRATLESLTQSQYAPTYVELAEPESQKKVVYAIPDGNYTKIIDKNTGFEVTSGYTTGKKTITFADNSTQEYQIFILTKAAQAPVKLEFKKN